MITEDLLYRSLIAMMKLCGHTIIGTSDNEHHRRLANAIKVIPAEEPWPVIVPSPLSGAFIEWERTLIISRTMVQVQRTVVTIIMTSQRAEAYLDMYDENDKEVIKNMVKAYFAD